MDLALGDKQLMRVEEGWRILKSGLHIWPRPRVFQGRVRMLDLQSEDHVFIIWPKARAAEAKIIADIKLHFEIVRIFEIHWRNQYFSRNLSRFYGTNLPDRSYKERHCGRGPFIVVLVRDANPLYAERLTSKGTKTVNVNLFDAKAKYRQWTGGGHKVHATNNTDETMHDCALLFGIGGEHYFDSPVSNEIEKLNLDLVGAESWKSISELFFVLNRTTEYVVLRNFECLPGQYTLDSHGDIDLLVSDYKEVSYVTNSTKVISSRYRVLNSVDICGMKVPFDFRYVGDGYYDSNWQKAILLRRELSPSGFYIPVMEDYFLTFPRFPGHPEKLQGILERGGDAWVRPVVRIPESSSSRLSAW